VTTSLLLAHGDDAFAIAAAVAEMASELDNADRIDLAPLAREALLLELPLAPLCQAECAGLCPTCGADLNAGPCGCAGVVADARWLALDELRERGKG